jgi:hypothetical protein
MQHGDWENADNHLIGMFISGQSTDETDDRVARYTEPLLLI